jgi:Rod binding domain-containing protein
MSVSNPALLSLPTLPGHSGSAPPLALHTPPSHNSPAALKLRRAAAEFESLLISNLWKSMKSTFADPSEDESLDPSHEALADWGIQAMSGAVANAGGFGIGALILKHLEPMLASSQNGNPSEALKDSGSLADISQ